MILARLFRNEAFISQPESFKEKSERLRKQSDMLLREGKNILMASGDLVDDKLLQESVAAVLNKYPTREEQLKHARTMYNENPKFAKGCRDT
ncbi:MAG: hypothetical protein ACKOAD_00870 [Gammaproteobacteria bacterium]